jgi:hypothetical protein
MFRQFVVISKTVKDTQHQHMCRGNLLNLSTKNAGKIITMTIETRERLLRLIRLVAAPEGYATYGALRPGMMASSDVDTNAALAELVKSGKLIDTGRGYRLR